MDAKNYRALAKVLVAAMAGGLTGGLGGAVAGGGAATANELIDKTFHRAETNTAANTLLNDVTACVAALAGEGKADPDMVRRIVDNAAERMRRTPPSMAKVGDAGFDRVAAARAYVTRASPNVESGSYLGEPDEGLCGSVMACAVTAWMKHPEGAAAIQAEFQRKTTESLGKIEHGVGETRREIEQVPGRLEDQSRQSRAERLLRDPRGTWDPALHSPSVLLRADYSPVPFVDIPSMPQSIAAWAQSDAPLAIRTLVAPGGSGKTRFALRGYEELRATGDWACCFPSGAGFREEPEPTKEDWEALLATYEHVLVVLDYAAARRNTLAALLAASQGARGKLRIVLLEREADPWWTQFTQDPSLSTLLAGPACSEPEPLSTAAAPREALFRAGCDKFAGPLGGSANAPLPAALTTDDLFQRPLYVLMAAYAAVTGKHVGSAEDALNQVLVHEYNTWWRYLGRDGQPVDEATRRAASQVGVLLTLAGSVEAGPTGRCWIRRLPALEERQDGLARRLHDTFLALYPGANLSGLQPDLLGEHLVFEALRPLPKGDCEAVLEAALPPEGKAEQVSRALTILARVAARRDEASDWIADTVNQLCVRVESSHDPSWIAGLVGAIPGEVDALQPLRIATLRRRLEYLKAHNAPRIAAIRGNVAIISNDLATAHGLSGNHRFALPYADAAVAELRALVKLTGELSYRIALAMCLSNRSTELSELGKHEHALVDATEAVDICRVMAKRFPMLYCHNLGICLNNRSGELSALGRHEQALVDATESVEIFSKLVKQFHTRYVPDLASALNNRSNWLSYLSRHDDALADMTAAVRLYRELAEHSPERFLPKLAMSLINRAGGFLHLKRKGAALTDVTEAAGIYRKLADRFPERYQSTLAVTLNNRSNCLVELRRNDEALVDVTEALELQRKLVQRIPERYEPELATSLTNCTNCLRALGRFDEAQANITEAIAIRRELVQRSPQRYQSELATSLGAQGRLYQAWGKHAAARDSAWEGIQVLEGPYLALPGAHSRVMKLLLSDYMEACKATGVLPDQGRLQPIRRAMAKLQSQRPT